MKLKNICLIPKLIFTTLITWQSHFLEERSTDILTKIKINVMNLYWNLSKMALNRDTIVKYSANTKPHFCVRLTMFFFLFFNAYFFLSNQDLNIMEEWIAITSTDILQFLCLTHKKENHAYQEKELKNSKITDSTTSNIIYCYSYLNWEISQFEQPDRSSISQISKHRKSCYI